jgi:large subunit ribosomal protein L13
MKTFMAKASELKRKWYIVDADGKHLGRLASEVAKILRGKHKAEYTPHCDVGDHVIVLNSDKIVLTGNKMEQKMYRQHSLYPGGLKEVKARIFFEKRSNRAIEIAVKGMLPKNSLGRAMFNKLKVYKDEKHEHQAQQPENLEIKV